jgi:hypothetical protein
VARMPGNFTGGDYRRCSPFRKVDWRWRCATEHLLVGDRLSPWEDPAIEHALKFQRAWNADGGSARQTAARQRWPELAEAYRLHERGGPLIDEIQARLLAAEPPKVISHKTAVGADVIAAYEKFFFDVSEFLGAIDWLLCDAVGLYDKPITEGLVWRYFAVAGGPLLVDLLVADFLGRPEPKRDDRHLLAERARFFVRFLRADSSAAVATLLKEGCRLFGRNWGITAVGGEKKMLDLQFRFLRMASRPLRRARPQSTGNNQNVFKTRRKDRHREKVKAAQTPSVREATTPGISPSQSSAA